jgi:carbamoyltransferase
MNILGIGGVLGDAAAAVIKDGHIAAAVEEAKLTRRPEPGRLPEAAIAACLKIAKLTPGDIDHVALARPLPTGSALSSALRVFTKAKVDTVDHHAAHAAAAYYVSPFEDATVITLDREGDLRCGARWHGEGNTLTLEEEILYPDSIAALYGHVTELLGLHARSDEHRVQWLSMTGKPRFAELFAGLIHDRTIDPVTVGFDAALGTDPADRADIAASMQHALETYVMRIADGATNVCLGGGVAWNAVLVSALERRYKGVFAQPAAGNAGSALGAALHAWHGVAGKTKRLDAGSYYLGPDFTVQEVKEALENCKLRFSLLETVPTRIAAAVAQLESNHIVAWMQGRMEFGPRALGNRSILASPRDPYSTENLNTFIKHREASRKFAASVPAEIAAEYFETGPNARHLASVGTVRPQYREQFRGAILSGNSGADAVRVHTVSKEDNPLYWSLLHAFGEKTGLPVLYNTSFNLFGEPLVCTPRDAVRSFYSSGIDAMVAGNFLLEK